MKLKVNWPLYPDQCVGLPSMHSASAQLDSPRCQAVVAYRTLLDDWPSQGYALPEAHCQVSGSRGSQLNVRPPPPPPPPTTSLTKCLLLSCIKCMKGRQLFFLVVTCEVFCLCGKQQSVLMRDCKTKRFGVASVRVCVRETEINRTTRWQSSFGLLW